MEDLPLMRKETPETRANNLQFPYTEECIESNTMVIWKDSHAMRWDETLEDYVNVSITSLLFLSRNTVFINKKLYFLTSAYPRDGWFKFKSNDGDEMMFPEVYRQSMLPAAKLDEFDALEDAMLFCYQEESTE